MKITSTTVAHSRVGDATLTSTSQREARERMVVDTSTDATRVHVEMRANGTAVVTLFKRAEGATRDDRDSIAWVEDTHLVLHSDDNDTVILRDRSLAF